MSKRLKIKTTGVYVRHKALPPKDLHKPTKEELKRLRAQGPYPIKDVEISALLRKDFRVTSKSRGLFVKP